MQGHMSFVRKSARKFLGVRTIAVQGNPRPSPPDRTFSASPARHTEASLRISVGAGFGGREPA